MGFFTDKDGDFCPARTIRTIAISSVALTIGLCSYETVDEGHRGFKVRFGEVVSTEPLQPGLRFKIPFIDSIYSMDIRTKLAKAETQALTSDSQPATIQFALNHNLSQEQVIPMYKKVGLDYEKVLIENTTLNVIQKVVGQTKADDLVNKKSEAIAKMEKDLADELEKNGIKVTNFGVPNLQFSRAFTESIERKETARQDSLREGYNTNRAKELANQKIEEARGEAESMKLVADAEAYAIRERAAAAASNGQAGLFEFIKKWNGEMPMVITIGNVGKDGITPMMDIGSFLSRPLIRPLAPQKISSQTVPATLNNERGARED